LIVSERKLAALAEKVQNDPGLEEKLAGASDVQDVVRILNAAGIETTQAELLKSEASRVLELSDAELEAAHVHARYTTDTIGGCITWVLTCCQ